MQLVSVEKCREILDKRGYADILLTDMRKAFDSINHDLLRRSSGVFIVNFKHISHLVLVFLSLTLNM